jgi:hypothetical protein
MMKFSDAMFAHSQPVILPSPSTQASASSLDSDSGARQCEPSIIFNKGVEVSFQYVFSEISADF